MKKIYLVLLTLSITLSSIAQDVVINYPYIEFNPTFDHYDYGELVITNNVDQSFDLKMRQEVISAPDGATMAICFGVTCFPPNGTDQYIYPAGFTLAPFGVDEALKITYDNNGSDENAQWKLVLFDENTNTDILVIDVFFDGPLGLTELLIDNSTISLPSPNPIVNNSVISYELPNNVYTGMFVMHNIAGSIVSEIELEENEGEIRLNSADFEKGVYFYSLMINDIALHTKRLVITQ